MITLEVTWRDEEGEGGERLEKETDAVVDVPSPGLKK